MRAEIFDVEHGACALLVLDNKFRIAIDCGTNSSTGWTLDRHLHSQNIGYLDELWLTNLDQDHLSGLVELHDKIAIGNILTNPSVTPELLWRLKYEGGQPTDDINRLCWLMQNGRVNLPFAALPHDVRIHYAWNIYGRPFTDSNNLSLAGAVQLGRVNLLFLGDLERAGLESLLTLPAFANSVRNTHVLVAPHHGRFNGCCPPLFDAMATGHPQICIVSDGAIKHESQDTLNWYRNRTRGVQTLDGQVRKVFTTRSDGKITIDIPPGGRGTVTTEFPRRPAISALRLFAPA